MDISDFIEHILPQIQSRFVIPTPEVYQLYLDWLYIDETNTTKPLSKVKLFQELDNSGLIIRDKSRKKYSLVAQSEQEQKVSKTKTVKRPVVKLEKIVHNKPDYLDVHRVILPKPEDPYTVTPVTSWTPEYLIHTADIHLKPDSRHEEYRAFFNHLGEILGNIKLYLDGSLVDELQDMTNSEILDKCLIVLAGDIADSFQTIRPETQLLLHRLFKTCCNNARTVLITGNHDMAEQNLSLLDVLVTPTIGLPTDRFYYLRYSGVYQFGELALVVSSLVDQIFIKRHMINLEDKIKKVVKVYHGALIGAKMNQYRQVEDSLENIGSSRYRNVQDFTGYDAVLLGDIHVPQQLSKRPPINYSGSPLEVKYDERLYSHGFLFWNLHLDTTQKYPEPNFIKIDNPYRWIEIHIQDDEWINQDTIKWVPYPKVRYHVMSVLPPSNDRLANIRNQIVQKLKTVYPDGYLTEFRKYDPPRRSGLQLSREGPSENTEVELQLEDPIQFFDSYLDSLEQLPDEDRILVSDRTEILSSLRDKHVAYVDAYGLTSQSGQVGEWIPLKIEFSGLFNYTEQVELSLEDGLTLITAPNTAGKTSLLKAIVCSIWGNVPGQDLRFCINRTIGKCYSKIEIYKDGNIYTVERRASLKQDGGLQSSAPKFYINYNQDQQQNLSLNGSSKMATERKIVEHFGTGEDFIRHNMMSPKIGGGNSIIMELKPKELKDHISKVFKLEFLDYLQTSNSKCRSDIRDCVNRSEVQVEHYTRDLETVNNELDNCNKSLGGIEWNNLENIIQSKNNQYRQLESKYRTELENQTSLKYEKSRLEKELDSHNLDHIRKQIVQLENKLDGTDKSKYSHIDLSRLKNELSRLKDECLVLKVKCQKNFPYDENSVDISQVDTHLVDEVSKWSTSREYMVKLDRLDVKIADYQDEIDRLSKICKQVQVHNIKGETRDTLESKLEICGSKLSNAKSLISSINTTASSTDSLQELESKADIKIKWLSGHIPNLEPHQPDTLCQHLKYYSKLLQRLESKQFIQETVTSQTIPHLNYSYDDNLQLESPDKILENLKSIAKVPNRRDTGKYNLDQYSQKLEHRKHKLAKYIQRRDDAHRTLAVNNKQLDRWIDCLESQGHSLDRNIKEEISRFIQAYKLISEDEKINRDISKLDTEIRYIETFIQNIEWNTLNVDPVIESNRQISIKNAEIRQKYNAHLQWDLDRTKDIKINLEHLQLYISNIQQQKTGRLINDLECEIKNLQSQIAQIDYSNLLENCQSLESQRAQIRLKLDVYEVLMSQRLQSLTGEMEKVEVKYGKCQSYIKICELRELESQLMESRDKLEYINRQLSMGTDLSQLEVEISGLRNEINTYKIVQSKIGDLKNRRLELEKSLMMANGDLENLRFKQMVCKIYDDLLLKKGGFKEQYMYQVFGKLCQNVNYLLNEMTQYSLCYGNVSGKSSEGFYLIRLDDENTGTTVNQVGYGNLSGFESCVLELIVKNVLNYLSRDVRCRFFAMDEVMDCFDKSNFNRFIGKFSESFGKLSYDKALIITHRDVSLTGLRKLSIENDTLIHG